MREVNGYADEADLADRGGFFCFLIFALLLIIYIKIVFVLLSFNTN